MKILGIDIGGTGIKGAVIDTRHGVLKSDRLRILTPHPATPEEVAKVVAQITSHFDWDGPLGCAFPGVVREGTVHTAANLDGAWVGQDAVKLFAKATAATPVTVINDADAAGVAELEFGAAHNNSGRVVVATLGTGIGTALFDKGRLWPNTELGHLTLHGADAELYAAESVRETEGLGWEDWAGRVSEYLRLVESLLWPDLFVLGGGVSKHGDKFLPLLETRTPVTTATMRNRAGMIGAATVASAAVERDNKRDKKPGKSKRKK